MDWQNLTAAQTVEQLHTDPEQGLPEAQVVCRLQKFGGNKMHAKKKKGLLSKFLDQLCDFMIIILLAAAAVSFAVSLLQGEADFTDPIIILAIVLLNAVTGVLQESRAEHAIAALQKVTAPETTVIRAGKAMQIPAENLVPGDLIRLEAGDLIPADARLLHTVGLKTEESALTGESVPIEKDATKTLQGKTALAQRCNMIYAGCAVVAGSGLAAVCETGMQTQLGQIADLINNQQDSMTPLQKRLAHTGKLLGIAAVVICALIFVMGLIRHIPALDTFMLSVSLAVAAIPEGLPAIVTVVLAFGVQKMAKTGAIIRRLPAVETLGSATVICSDKTGTLTQNKMTVTRVCGADGALDPQSSDFRQALALATLCNNATLDRIDGTLTAKGDPTETAIVLKCAEGGVTKAALEQQYVRIKELPFDSVRKRMVTVHRHTGGYRVIVKGAPDILLPLCSRYNRQNTAEPLTPSLRQRFEQRNLDMASDALRVLGVAYKDLPAVPAGSELEQDLIFCGLIGMMDPPREQVRRSVALCKRAGIKPVMITGDHKRTACAIAAQIGIGSGQHCTAVSGEELDHMDDHTLRRNVQKYDVFARVSPAHKVRIVKAYQQRGEVVAMTGDGINDAPALKAADIGCAMGQNGTQVAKSAADMVLTDDNFSTIVAAVKQGRGIYDNIRKAVHFLLSCNIGEILTIFIASLCGLPTPLIAIQLLWVNLVTDSLPAIALGFEPVEPDVMYRKPVHPKASMFSGGLGVDILLEGCMIGGFTLLGFLIGRTLFDVSGTPYAGRTMAFCVLSLSQLVHAFNVRSNHSLFKIGFFSNLKMVGAFVICAIMQISVVALPPLAAVFKTIPLNLPQWGVVILLAMLPLIVCELIKRFFKEA